MYFYLKTADFPDLIRCINDPEHPLTLEELNVVDCDNVHVSCFLFMLNCVRHVCRCGCLTG